MLTSILAARPELALFAALVVGYGVGAIKIGPFKLGGVAGTLLAALVIGQIGIHVDAELQRFMFTLFVYALGFSVAPQFFASINKTTWTWSLLVVIEVVMLLLVVVAATWLFKLDVGTASGLLAGAATESAMVGTATEAIGKLGLSAADITAQQANVATAYALSYCFSLITIVLFASQVAPKLLGINLQKEARGTLAKLGGIDANLDGDQSKAFPALISRALLVTAAAGKSIAAVELALSGNATIEGLRRHDTDVKVTDNCLLETGDEVAIAGLRTALADAARIIGPEIGDPSAVEFVVETRDVVLTRWPKHRAALASIVEFLRASAIQGVYLAGVTRDDRKLPASKGSMIRRGDVVHLFGKVADVARAARLLGTAEPPGVVTDFVYLGGGMIVGILIGMVTIPIAGVAISLGSAGSLLSGLAFGWMRARRPTFGAFPPAATRVLKDLGLAIFIASIGLSAAPSVLALLGSRGWELPLAAVCSSLLPTTISLYVGRYLLHMEPAILCGAIAGQQASTPAINATEAVAGNPVPVIGYTLTYALANIVLPLLGPLWVAAFAAYRGLPLTH
jgi:aspartate-alanine antiporter